MRIWHVIKLNLKWYLTLGSGAVRTTWHEQKRLKLQPTSVLTNSPSFSYSNNNNYYCYYYFTYSPSIIIIILYLFNFFNIFQLYLMVDVQFTPYEEGEKIKNKNKNKKKWKGVVIIRFIYICKYITADHAVNQHFW